MRRERTRLCRQPPLSHPKRRALTPTHLDPYAPSASTHLGPWRAQEMYEAEQTKQWTQDDDAIFDQYAQMCLDEYIADGKNPKVRRGRGGA